MGSPPFDIGRVGLDSFRFNAGAGGGGGGHWRVGFAGLVAIPGKSDAGSSSFPFSRADKRFSDPSAIDAEYEVKDSDEKK